MEVAADAVGGGAVAVERAVGHDGKARARLDARRPVRAGLDERVPRAQLVAHLVGEHDQVEGGGLVADGRERAGLVAAGVVADRADVGLPPRPLPAMSLVITWPMSNVSAPIESGITVRFSLVIPVVLEYGSVSGSVKIIRSVSATSSSRIPKSRSNSTLARLTLDTMEASAPSTVPPRLWVNSPVAAIANRSTRTVGPTGPPAGSSTRRAAGAAPGRPRRRRRPATGGSRRRRSKSLARWTV